MNGTIGHGGRAAARRLAGSVAAGSCRFRGAGYAIGQAVQRHCAIGGGGTARRHELADRGFGGLEPGRGGFAGPDSCGACDIGRSQGAGVRIGPEIRVAKVDRLELGTGTVTGDREQPKVMYVVPWKKSDIGDLAGKPMNSLVDEILAPVDRDVFKREVVYYHAVQADTSQNGAPPKPAQQGEK